LGDGIRVLSRGLARIAGHCKRGALKVVVNHTRAVKHRLLEISRAAKSLTPANKRRMKKSYKKLLALTTKCQQVGVQNTPRLATGSLTRRTTC